MEAILQSAGSASDLQNPYNSTILHRNMIYVAVQLFGICIAIERAVKHSRRVSAPMPCRLPDLGAVEADVLKAAVVECGELPNANPVLPPRGKRPGREKRGTWVILS
jgi:hypothetical protein